MKLSQKQFLGESSCVWGRAPTPQELILILIEMSLRVPLEGGVGCPKDPQKDSKEILECLSSRSITHVLGKPLTIAGV